MKYILQFSLIVALVISSFASFGQTVTLTANHGDTICAGTNMNFHATVTPMDTTYRFRWIRNSAVVGGTMPNYFTNTLADGDTVYCLLTNAAGDTVLDTSNYYIMTVLTSVHPSPITGPDSVCLGSTITLFDSVAGGIWKSNNTGIFTIDSLTGVVTTVAPGQARAVYTITTGSCPDSVRLRIRVQVPGMPLVGPTEVCIDSMFRVFDTARGGTWTLSDASLAMQIAPQGIFQATAAGTLTIHHNVNNACGIYDDSITINIIDCLAGVGNITLVKSGLTIVPNPAADGSMVSVGTTDGILTITDVTGRIVRKQNISGTDRTISVAGMTKGIYVVTLQNNSQLYTGKLVIE